MTLTITTHRMPDAAIAIHPDGVISSENAAELRDRVTAVLAATRPRTIVVNLGAVPAIDDAGLDALVSGRSAAAECDATLVVADPHPSVYYQLRTHGLTDLLVGRNAGRVRAASARVRVGERRPDG